MKKSFKNQSAAEKFIKKMQDQEDVRGYNMYAESTAEYAKSLEKIANDRKLKKISKKDKETLSKIAQLLKTANEDDISEIDWSATKNKWVGAGSDWMNEDLDEAVKFWKVTITKKAGKLFKGQNVVTKARNSAEAIKKGIKQMKGNPALVPGGSVTAKLDESIKEGAGLWANIHKRRKSGKRMRKKGEKGAPTAAAMRQAKGESVNEDKFQLVNMSRNTARHADKLAKRVGLDTDFNEPSNKF